MGKTISTNKLAEILAQHRLWLTRDGGEQAVLTGFDLRGHDLMNTDLRKVRMNGTDFRGVNMHKARMNGADFRGSDMRKARMSWADLRCSDIRGVDMRGADLRWADFRGAHPRGADFRGSDPHMADLGLVDLSGVIGLLPLPVNDPRGYRVVAVRHRDGWMISAGCRWYTIAGARQHWGKDYRKEREIGDLYLAAFDWLEQQPVPRCEGEALNA